MFHALFHFTDKKAIAQNRNLINAPDLNHILKSKIFVNIDG